MENDIYHVHKYHRHFILTVSYNKWCNTIDITACLLLDNKKSILNPSLIKRKKKKKNQRNHLNTNSRLEAVNSFIVLYTISFSF